MDSLTIRDEAAAEWLAHIADMLGAEAHGMLTRHTDGSHTLISQGHEETAALAYRDHYSRLDPLASLLAVRPAGRALILDTDSHPAYLAQRELMDDYIRPNGIRHVAAAQWKLPDGSLRLLGFQRFAGAAPFSVEQGRELDKLIHHWRIGNAMPQPPGFDDSGTGARRRNCDIAAQLPTPLVVVDAHLSMIWANLAALEENGELWSGLRKHGNRTRGEEVLLRPLRQLVLNSLRGRCEAEALIEAANERERTGTWFAVAGPLIGKPGLALLRLTAVHGQARGLRARLQRLYRLTAAEAELAAMLTEGDSLERIAEHRRVALETVRAQLKSVFRKTGAHRQGELVSWVVKLARA